MKQKKSIENLKNWRTMNSSLRKILYWIGILLFILTIALSKRVKASFFFLMLAISISFMLPDFFDFAKESDTREHGACLVWSKFLSLIVGLILSIVLFFIALYRGI